MFLRHPRIDSDRLDRSLRAPGSRLSRRQNRSCCSGLPVLCERAVPLSPHHGERIVLCKRFETFGRRLYGLVVIWVGSSAELHRLQADLNRWAKSSNSIRDKAGFTRHATCWRCSQYQLHFAGTSTAGSSKIVTKLPRTLGLTSAFFHCLLGTRFLQVLSGLERTRLPHACSSRQSRCRRPAGETRARLVSSTPRRKYRHAVLHHGISYCNIIKAPACLVSLTAHRQSATPCWGERWSTPVGAGTH